MDAAIVGLAGPGERIVHALAAAGLRVAAWAGAAGAVPALASGHASVAALVHAVSPPRIVWLCVAPGRATELALQEVWPELTPGDVIVDAGDSDHRDAPRRAAALRSVRLGFVDCGICASGTGRAVVLLGGDAPAVAAVQAQARIVAGAGLYAHCGGAGAGHYARMVTDAVASAQAWAIGEGAALLAAHEGLALSPPVVAELMRVIRRGPAGEGETTRGAAQASDVAAEMIASAAGGRVATPVLSLVAMLARERVRDVQADPAAAAPAHGVPPGGANEGGESTR